MKKKTTRFTAIALICLLVLSACGNPANENSFNKVTEPIGFNEATNQIITFQGINFSIPAYYDFKDSKSTEMNVHYYPENEDYASSLIFYAEEVSVTPADFKAGKQTVADAILESFASGADSASSEDMTVAGLSALHITFIKQENQSTTTGHLVVANNIYMSRLIMIFQVHDSKDQSDFDYDGDFIKILESATLVESSTKEPIATKPNEPIESAKPSTEEMIGSGDLGDFYVEIKGGQLAKDYENKLVCIITYSWTNNSDETTSALYEIEAKAFQDGVELDTAYFILDSSVYESGTSMKDVRPGATADVQCAFVLANDTSDVEFELSELFTFSKNAPKVIKVFKMN